MNPRLVLIQCKNKNIIWHTCKQQNGVVILNERHIQENSDFLKDKAQTEEVEKWLKNTLLKSLSYFSLWIIRKFY